MKSMLLLVVIVGLFGLREKTTTNNLQIVPAKDDLQIDSVKLVDFNLDIKPILQSRCSPCHFTGGKMYERMPFDKHETILSHEVGILRRIKTDPDAKLIRDFIRQSSKGKKVPFF